VSGLYWVLPVSGLYSVLPVLLETTGRCVRHDFDKTRYSKGTTETRHVGAAEITADMKRVAFY